MSCRRCRRLRSWRRGHRRRRDAWLTPLVATAATYALALAVFGPSVARAHSARDLADYFNSAGPAARDDLRASTSASHSCITCSRPFATSSTRIRFAASASSSSPRCSRFRAMRPPASPADLLRKAACLGFPLLAHAARHAAGPLVSLKSQPLGPARWDLQVLGFSYANVRAFMRGPKARISIATSTQHTAMYANTLR